LTERFNLGAGVEKGVEALAGRVLPPGMMPAVNWASRNLLAPPVRHVTQEGLVSNAAQAVEAGGRALLGQPGQAGKILPAAMRTTGYGIAPSLTGAVATGTGARRPDELDARADRAANRYMAGAGLLGGPPGTAASLYEQNLPGPDRPGKSFADNYLDHLGRRTGDVGLLAGQLARDPSKLLPPLQDAAVGYGREVGAAAGVGPQAELEKAYQAYQTAPPGSPEQAKALEAIRGYDLRAPGAHRHYAEQGRGVAAEGAKLREVAAALPPGDPRRDAVQTDVLRLENAVGGGPGPGALPLTRGDVARAQAGAGRQPALRPGEAEAVANRYGPPAAPAAPAPGDQPAAGGLDPKRWEAALAHVPKAELASLPAASAALAAYAKQGVTAPDQLAAAVLKGGGDAAGVAAVAKGLGAAGKPVDPGMAETFWGRLGTGSKVMLGLGVSLMVLPALLSLFGDDDNDGEGPGGRGFLRRALPFLGAGLALWGAGGAGNEGPWQTPNVSQLGQSDFWSGVRNDLGRLGTAAGQFGTSVGIPGLK
jgi:hypothetical protein